MILADTSVVIDGLRDDSARFWAALEARYPDETRWTIALPTRMEVLMGARNQQDWRTLEQYLERWERLPVHSNDWDEAARIYTDLRGIGIRGVGFCFFFGGCSGVGGGFFHTLWV